MKHFAHADTDFYENAKHVLEDILEQYKGMAIQHALAPKIKPETPRIYNQIDAQKEALINEQKGLLIAAGDISLYTMKDAWTLLELWRVDALQTPRLRPRQHLILKVQDYLWQQCGNET